MCLGPVHITLFLSNGSCLTNAALLYLRWAVSSLELSCAPPQDQLCLLSLKPFPCWRNCAALYCLGRDLQTNFIGSLSGSAFSIFSVWPFIFSPSWFTHSVVAFDNCPSCRAFLKYVPRGCMKLNFPTLFVICSVYLLTDSLIAQFLCGT